MKFTHLSGLFLHVARSTKPTAAVAAFLSSTDATACLQQALKDVKAAKDDGDADTVLDGVISSLTGLLQRQNLPKDVRVGRGTLYFLTPEDDAMPKAEAKALFVSSDLLSADKIQRELLGYISSVVP